MSDKAIGKKLYCEKFSVQNNYPFGQVNGSSPRSWTWIPDNPSGPERNFFGGKGKAQTLFKIGLWLVLSNLDIDDKTTKEKFDIWEQTISWQWCLIDYWQGLFKQYDQPERSSRQYQRGSGWQEVDDCRRGERPRLAAPRAPWNNSEFFFPILILRFWELIIFTWSVCLKMNLVGRMYCTVSQPWSLVVQNMIVRKFSHFSEWLVESF